MTSFAVRTHPGLRRDNNEDNYEADAALGLWVVADGLGGHSNGEVASQIACATIRSEVARGRNLKAAIENAHQAVLSEITLRAADRDSAKSDDSVTNKMGTTVVALRLAGSHYEIAWVGDSRAYLYDGTLHQLTRDHSAVNDLLDHGLISADQAATHPQRHALSRSLGVSATHASGVSVVTGKLGVAQQLLLCSDGLTNELSDRVIAEELGCRGDLNTRADALVAAALAQGGRDNVTLILLSTA